MVRIASEARALERSIYSVDRRYDVGCRVRLGLWGLWPLYEVTAIEDDGALVVSPVKEVDTTR